MKSLSLLTTLFTLFCAPSHAAPSAPAFSEREAYEVRSEIDNLCGDSWCESGFNFVFDDFGCAFERRECHVTFRLYPLDRKDLTSPPQTCRFAPLSSAADLAHWRADGSVASLTEGFYRQVDACLSSAIEHRSRAVRY